jgi:hypothetical protein
MNTEAMINDRDAIAWLTLKRIPDLGNRSLLRLVQVLGSPTAVLDADLKTLERIPGLRFKARYVLSKGSRPGNPADIDSGSCVPGQPEGDPGSSRRDVLPGRA